MTEVDLFGSDLRSISPIVSAMTHLNCHYVVSESLEKRRILMGFHGSEKLAHLSEHKIRAIYTASNGKGVYVIIQDEVIRVGKSGTFTKIGKIETDNTFVQMADSGNELIIVDTVNGYIVDLTAEEKDQVVTKITAEFFPDDPTGVIFNTGRFLVISIKTGKFYGSDIYDGFTWEGLNFATAETYPDNIIAIVNGNFGTFYLMGNQTIETWYNDGGSGFPYSLMSGGVLNYGVTVLADGIVRLGEEIIFMGTSQSEGKNFYSLRGGQVQNITNPEMSDIIRKLRLPDLYKAVGYADNSSPIFQVTFEENGKTYFYDGKTGLWGQRESRGLPGHIFELGAYAYGEQYFTSRLDGTIFKLNPLLIKDGDYFQDLEFVGRHMVNGEERFFVDALQFKLEVGQGQINDYNKPSIGVISYSKDGGYSWTPEIFGSMGKIGEYLIRLIWRRLGTCRDIVFKLKITDLVERKIISAYMILR